MVATVNTCGRERESFSLVCLLSPCLFLINGTGVKGGPNSDFSFFVTVIVIATTKSGRSEKGRGEVGGVEVDEEGEERGRGGARVLFFVVFLGAASSPGLELGGGKGSQGVSK